MRPMIPLLLTLLASACASSAPMEPAVSVPLESAFRLAAGESASVRDTPLRIRFDGVDGDSRCPADVTCVWQGDAVVRLRLSGDGEPRTLELHTGVDPRSAAAGDYRVTLEALDPAPRSGDPIPDERYAATLRVVRAR